MMEEISKRSFVRPLLFWVLGILLYSTSCALALFLLLGALLIVSFGIVRLVSWREHTPRAYSQRWVPGVFLSICLVALSFEVCYIHDLCQGQTSHTHSFIRQKASEAQAALVHEYDRLNLSDEEKSVLATLTLGYRQTMRADTKRRFSITGVSHVLAVSGFHVAVVCGFLSLLVGNLPGVNLRRLRHPLLIIIVWIFVYITGLSPSAIRAATMFTLFATARILRRTTDSYNTWAATAFLMLVYDPSYLFDIGFQLSYAAVLFVLFYTPRIQPLIEVRNPIFAQPWQWIAVSLAAQFGTAALCCYYFGRISTLFLIANLPVTFLVTLLMPITFLWLTLPPNGLCESVFRHTLEATVRLLLRVIENLSDIPFSVYSLRFNGWHLMESLIFMLLLALYQIDKKPRNLLAALTVALILSLHLLIGNY